MVRREEKRLVDEAVVEKKLVVVALVPVAVVKVKPLVKVDEAVERKPFKSPIVVEVETPYDWTVKGKGEPLLTLSNM